MSKKIIRLTESELLEIVKKVISEQSYSGKKITFYDQPNNQGKKIGAYVVDDIRQIGSIDRETGEIKGARITFKYDANTQPRVIATYEPKNNNSFELMIFPMVLNQKQNDSLKRITVYSNELVQLIKQTIK